MVVTNSKDREPPWLLLVFSLAKSNASLRVSVWRKLQRFGVLPLGNSGYLLPNTSENHERFEWLTTTIRTARGESSVVEVQSIDNCPASQLKARFCRCTGSRLSGTIEGFESKSQLGQDS